MVVLRHTPLFPSSEILSWNNRSFLNLTKILPVASLINVTEG